MNPSNISRYNDLLNNEWLKQGMSSILH
jgi:hypothetical protein